MKKVTALSVTLALSLSAGLVTGQNIRFSDPETVIKNEFWGNLYAEGGSSFFCEKPFTSKGFVLTDGYIYPLADVRSALDCGTTSQCKRDNRYRQIASDLHNMVPVTSRIEMRRRNARYENIGASAQPDDCGIRESTQFSSHPSMPRVMWPGRWRTWSIRTVCRGWGLLRCFRAGTSWIRRMMASWRGIAGLPRFRVMRIPLWLIPG